MNLRPPPFETVLECFAELAATTQDAPGPKLEGAAAALVGAATADLDGVLHRLSAALARRYASIRRAFEGM